MAAIFISHSSRDNEMAAEIKTWLTKLGYENVFLDFDTDTGLGAGRNWERQLYEAIERCHAVILVVTPAWMDSKWCFAEERIARGLGKSIFPIIRTPDDMKIVGPELQSVQAAMWNTDGKEHLGRRLGEIAAEIARGHRYDPHRPPWPGILSFEAEDAAVFFGRDPEIRKVAELLETRRTLGGPRLLLAVGASGSGKSSLMKAGVLPYLARDPGRFVVLPPFRPGLAPLSSLAKTLAEALGKADRWQTIRETLAGERTRTGLAALLEELRVGPAREATALVAIDQFEEAFTLAEPAERDALFDLLTLAADKQRPLPLLVLATVRSDLLGEILKANSFKLAYETWTVGPLPRDRLAEIIEGPARVAAIRLEPGLVARILSDVNAPESLPLLAFALRELHDRHGRDSRLTIAEYEELGDRTAMLSPIENVVRRRAEDVLRALAPSNAQTTALKEAFVSFLVRSRDDGTFVRRPARLDTLPEASRAIVDALVDARLITKHVKQADGPDASEVTVEVSHEALFKAWPLLRGWLTDERDFLVGKARLAQSLADWTQTSGPQRKQALLQGLALKRAQQWAASHPEGFSQEELQFLRASRKQARRKLAGLAALAAAVIVLAIGVTAPRLYAEYVRRTALECDLYAAELDNNVHVPGVAFDRIIPEIAVPACRKAVAAEPDNPRLMDNLARALDRSGDKQEAVQWYRKAADRDWPWAQNSLGVMTLYGQGTRRDFAAGVALIRKAAERNTPDAVANYAGTDLSVLFEDAPALVKILQNALVGRKLLEPAQATGSFDAPTQAALRTFGELNGLDNDGVTLKLLDTLGVVDLLSDNFKQMQDTSSAN